MTDALAELLAKYLEIRALRKVEADAAQARPRLRALAARHPGALRELDRLPLEEVDRRIAQLRAGEEPAWARTLVAYHGWLRVGLRIRQAHGRGAEPAVVQAWLREWHQPTAGEPTLEELDLHAIVALLRPPGGRLSRWVLGRIALDRGITPEAAEAEAFGTGNH